jgi:aubergine-like protein
LNVRIKNVLREKGLFEIGRTSKYYDPASINKNKIEGHGLKVWRGYKTALHVFGAQPYLLIDFSSRVLRSETAL